MIKNVHIGISKQPRKQRLKLYNTALHKKQKLVSSHLSPELRKKHNIRSLPVRKGDTVKVLRGEFKGKKVKVEKVDLGDCKVYLESIFNIKKDGNKKPRAIHPSNLIIMEVNLEDKRRLKNKEKKNG